MNDNPKNPQPMRAEYDFMGCLPMYVRCQFYEVYCEHSQARQLSFQVAGRNSQIRVTEYRFYSPQWGKPAFVVPGSANQN